MHAANGTARVRFSSQAAAAEAVDKAASALNRRWAGAWLALEYDATPPGARGETVLENVLSHEALVRVASASATLSRALGSLEQPKVVEIVRKPPSPHTARPSQGKHTFGRNRPYNTKHKPRTVGDGLLGLVSHEEVRVPRHSLHHLLVVAQPLVEVHVFRPRGVQDVFELSAGEATSRFARRCGVG